MEPQASSITMSAADAGYPLTLDDIVGKGENPSLSQTQQIQTQNYPYCDDYATREKPVNFSHLTSKQDVKLESDRSPSIMSKLPSAVQSSTHEDICVKTEDLSQGECQEDSSNSDLDSLEAEEDLPSTSTSIKSELRSDEGDEKDDENQQTSGDDGEGQLPVDAFGTAVYICGKCALMFADEDSLRRHITLMHTNGDDDNDVQEETEDEDKKPEAPFPGFYKDFKQECYSPKLSSNSRKIRKTILPKKTKINSNESGDYIVSDGKHLFQSPVSSTEESSENCLLQKQSRSRSKTKPLSKRSPNDVVVESNTNSNMYEMGSAEKGANLVLKIRRPTEKQYKCAICDKEFGKKAGLSAHQRIHAADKLNQCPKCDESFHLKNDLSEHLKSHKGIQGTHCSICDKDFTTNLHLRVHLRLHNGDKRFKCSQCGAAFSHSSTLCQHVKLHSAVKQYECEVCHKRFAQGSGLSRHMKLHDDYEKKFKCTSCDMVFHYAHILQQHLRTHSGEKPYTCQVCGKGFHRRNLLTMHARIHTGVKDYPCSICEKPFISTGALQKHMLVHTRERRHECKTCGSRYATLFNLRIHERTHTNEMPFQCSTCGKVFHAKSNLKTHMRVHSGERPFKCDICTNSYTQYHALQRHRRSHTNEKPFKCDTCGKGFYCRPYLKRHVLTHTGERPFSCTTCGKAFSRRSTLNRHMKTHTTDQN